LLSLSNFFGLVYGCTRKKCLKNFSLFSLLCDCTSNYFLVNTFCLQVFFVAVLVCESGKRYKIIILEILISEVLIFSIERDLCSITRNKDLNF